MGEQDVADQQGAFLCREDLTFVGSSFLVAISLFSRHLCLNIKFYICENSIYVKELSDKSQSILYSKNYVFRVLRYIGVNLVVSLIQYDHPF